MDNLATTPNSEIINVPETNCLLTDLSQAATKRDLKIKYTFL
jgi:hypothetical protein